LKSSFFSVYNGSVAHHIARIIRDRAVNALKGHRKTKVLLEDLAGMPRVDYRWVEKFNNLYEGVGRHMEMK
jgi:hypothetical protein